MKQLQFTLAQLAESLGAELRGDAQKVIYGLATLQDANSDQLSFLANAHYRKQLEHTQAGALLLSAADAADYSGNCLVVADPYLSYSKLSHYFDRTPKAAVGIHPSAVIADSALIDSTASIGPGVVIDEQAVIEAGVVIGAHCFIGARTRIGAGGRLLPRVTLYHDTSIGQRVVIQSGAVIGGEGFGFAKHNGVWNKGNGVKLDNQIQIAHNVQIGDHTALAACVGISGSAKIGRNCMLAGGVGLVGHIDICDDVFITGMTMVTHSITEPGAYSSGTAMQPAADWKKNAVRFRQLDALAKRVRGLEKQIQK